MIREDWIAGELLKLLMNYTLSFFFLRLMFTLLCPKNAIFAAATYICTVHTYMDQEGGKGGGKGGSFCVNITTEPKKSYGQDNDLPLPSPPDNT